VICIDVYRGRLSLAFVSTVALLIFHPTWTISSTRQIDCGVFTNAVASQIVLLAIGALAGVTLVGFVRSERRLARFWRDARRRASERASAKSA
jgi:hypothetical protein